MKYRALSCVFAALFASLPVIATPVSLSVTASATLQPGTSDSVAATYAGSPDSLNISAFAWAQNGDDYVSGLVGTSMWSADGNSGNILLQTSRNLVGGSDAAFSDPTRFDYYFIADATGDFVLDYVMTLTGNNTFGLNGVMMSFGVPSSPSFQYFDANAGSGQFVASVVAGELFRFNLDMSANVYGQNLTNLDGTLVGWFSFSMPASNSVPDTTGTAGLILVSLTGLAALRRRVGR